MKPVVKLAVFSFVAATLPVSWAFAKCRQASASLPTYTICSFDPARRQIRMYNNDTEGKPYGSFAALSSALWHRHEFIAFAMNGGMYESDLSPVGLFVERGHEHKRINTAEGWGNFHLLPNGVFFVKGHVAGVLDTQTYIARGMKPDFATQSGPMLVIDGKIHPRFLPDSDSLKIRNGVGVSKDGRVHFAISNMPVRFYDFAVLFRDELGAENALFLDGSISSVDMPDLGRRDSLFPLGPIIALVEQVPD